MAFSLQTYPVMYRAFYDGAGWVDEYIERPHKSAEEEMSADGGLDSVLKERNKYEGAPLVSYTSQYGLAVFEGLKALPQKNGGLAVFRPQKNAERFFRSMAGLYMPPFPPEKFTKACLKTVRDNSALGFKSVYKKEWEAGHYMNAEAVYIRPFTLSEGGIGVSLSREPSVFIVCNPVSAYFSADLKGAVVSKRIRATPNGTGWIKAASNYVISALAKHEAAKQGFMECVFLDATERKYIEEGSSCNIFFYLKSGELVTPELGDTILPGITRESVIELAKDKGVSTSERKISIGEALSNAEECFVTGTAAGVTPIESLTYEGRTAVFSGGRTSGLTASLRDTLKGIQYGALEDTRGWMVQV